MSGLKKISEVSKRQADELVVVLGDGMRDALKLIGQVATTKYMIVSRGERLGRGKGVGPNTTAPVNPTRLTMRSGRLARSLVRFDDPESRSKVLDVSLSQVKGQVGTAVPYAAIHETGGTTSPHDIVPRVKKALRFFIGDKEIIVRRVHHPGSKIPARPFLAPAIADPDTVKGVQNIFAVRVKGKLAEAMQLALGTG